MRYKFQVQETKNQTKIAKINKQFVNLFKIHSAKVPEIKHLHFIIKVMIRL